MATSVQMPALGESVTEGTVTRWLKQEGDTVELDEPLLEVSTDKVDTEIPSPAAGVLQKIVAQEDDTVEVGGELAVIGDKGEDTGGGDGEAQAAEENPPKSPPRRRSRQRSLPRSREQAAEEQESRTRHPEPAEKPAAKSDGGEATPVLMPELGESVTEGTVTRWLKKVGDSVEVDEPLVEVSTDKVDTEIPSPVAGTLVSITAEEDDASPSAASWPRSAQAGAAPAETEPNRHRRKSPKPEPKPKPKARSPNPRKNPSPNRKRKPSPSRRLNRRKPAEPKPQPKPQAAPEPSGDGAPYVTPLVRKLASENNIDLAAVKGTGSADASESRMCWPPRRPRRHPRKRRRPPRRPPHPRRRRRNRRRPLHWRICAAPLRRPTGSGRSPRRRHANPCRPQRN